jgi:hypothetical protein
VIPQNKLHEGDTTKQVAQRRYRKTNHMKATPQNKLHEGDTSAKSHKGDTTEQIQRGNKENRANMIQQNKQHIINH